MNTPFTPASVGRYTLLNRLVMAPMTRSRAQADGTPSELAALYYAQRASIGLVIAEGTQPSDDGQGYLTTPGIYTDSHVEGWKRVTDAVHQKGGRIFIQLMHAGRMSHPDNTPHHRTGVAPSAIAPDSQMFTAILMRKSRLLSNTILTTVAAWHLPAGHLDIPAVMYWLAGLMNATPTDGLSSPVRSIRMRPLNQRRNVRLS